MQNKTIFVTGSSRGIGRAVAEAFCGLGFNVAVNGVDGRRLTQTLTELSEISPNVTAVCGDMSCYETAAAAVAEIGARFGPVDVLVNNAAITQYGLFTDTTHNDWNRLIDVNIKAMLNCSHLVLPQMVTRKSGCIINISSIWGQRGASCEAVYSLTKGAVNGFTKALAKEVAPSGVRVNAAAFGVINTDMNANLTAEEKAALINEIGLSRFGTPAEAADVAVYLASSQSTYITGQIITADGAFR